MRGMDDLDLAHADIFGPLLSDPTVTISPMRDHHVVSLPADRPDIEGLIDDTWWPGELRMWRRTPTGWEAQVQWRDRPGNTRITTATADPVREATWISKSIGR